MAKTRLTAPKALVGGASFPGSRRTEPPSDDERRIPFGQTGTDGSR